MCVRSVFIHLNAIVVEEQGHPVSEPGDVFEGLVKEGPG